MSYQVLARKWRPRTFNEMVGQQHVLKALTNALDQGRVHHAFLFTGTRGVGKTTVARVFAKALNCLEGISSEPCGKCDACTSIDEGRFVDLIEVDAASRTRVDETRELLDNVQYAPTAGRYKVYLIDEVHMLSAHSFNALLKTLEEPPPHVKFLLATTDPQKLPVTVLSRCLQFNLKRLSEEQISSYLAELLKREEVGGDPAALHELAIAADGSMRDALSLMDQAIAYGGGEVRETAVRDMLGTIDRGQVFELLKTLHAGDASDLLDKVAQLDERAPDYSAVLDELASQLQQLAVQQLAPASQRAKFDDPQREKLAAMATEVVAEDVQLWYQIALHGKRDLPLAPQPRAGFEMALLRMMLFKPQVGPAAGPNAGPNVGPVGQAAAAPVAQQSRSAPVGSSQPANPQLVNAQPAAPAQPSASPRLSRAEMALQDAGVSPSAAPVQANEPPPWDNPVLPPAVEAAPPASPTSPAAHVPSQPTVPATAPATTPAGATADRLTDWASSVMAMGLRGAVLQLAKHCLLQSQDERKVTLQIEPANAYLITERSQGVIEKALQTYLANPALKLEFNQSGAAAVGAETIAVQDARKADARQQAAVDSIESDPIVQALKQQFDATVRPGSIRPVDK